ncbi:hypothetical protein DUT91_23625 [Phyllobacterium salinisoli]|uniref:Uncharacterized protein n=1 Tax=Phyllobacterium salinisoli TaxID=1899321 RepID=A0A368JWF6_9HYPH|nr:hypothetical protein [Phyllobacterium salinisoli]RCS21506.1 hypothetical protein DUT91_23625 [Phyllobacterium salinisoli]
MKRLHLISALSAWLILSGCVSFDEIVKEQMKTDEQRDQERCSSYGFRIGTGGFGNCMLNLSAQREAEAANRRLAEAMSDIHWGPDDKERSFMRSGDSRFPVCSATSEDADLDVSSGRWYGKACRAQ